MYILVIFDYTSWRELRDDIQSKMTDMFFLNFVNSLMS